MGERRGSTGTAFLMRRCWNGVVSLGASSKSEFWMRMQRIGRMLEQLQRPILNPEPTNPRSREHTHCFWGPSRRVSLRATPRKGSDLVSRIVSWCDDACEGQSLPFSNQSMPFSEQSLPFSCCPSIRNIRRIRVQNSLFELGAETNNAVSATPYQQRVPPVMPQ